MLNKPNLFGRRDDIAAARDPRPIAAGQTAGSSSIAATANPALPTAAANNGSVAAAPAAPERPDVAAKPESPRSENRLIVGPEVKLKGAEILDCDTLVVEGRVEATMDSRVISIAENGSFCGKVGIDIAEIHGSFDGELVARNRLVVHATGRVSGKIRYGKILIEEGGEVSGDVRSLASDKDGGSSTKGASVASLEIAKPMALATLS